MKNSKPNTGNCFAKFRFLNTYTITDNMGNTLNQSAPIFWKGKPCKFIKWDTLNFGGKLKIKIDKKFIEVDISELTN
jgi:hypothetical protein